MNHCVPECFFQVVPDVVENVGPVEPVVINGDGVLAVVNLVVPAGGNENNFPTILYHFKVITSS